jgi:hypothetical protein
MTNQHKQEPAVAGPSTKELEKRVAQLERELATEKKDCIKALQERDYNGHRWRHYETLCNAAGIHDLTLDEVREKFK